MKRTYQPGSLDIALELLRAHHLPYRWAEHDLCRWEAVCPACRHESWALQIREPHRGGPVSLTCLSGCTIEEIKHALESEPVHEQVHAALQLAEQARTIAARALLLAYDDLSDSVVPSDTVCDSFERVTPEQSAKNSWSAQPAQVMRPHEGAVTCQAHT